MGGFLATIVAIYLFFVWLGQIKDVFQRSKKELPSKIFWILGMLIPWFGQFWVPAIVALFYKYTVRDKLENQRTSIDRLPPWEKDMEIESEKMEEKNTERSHRRRSRRRPEVEHPNPPPPPRRHTRRHHRPPRQPMFRPDPNRFALILEGVTPGNEDDVIEGIMIVRKCDETRAKKLLNTPALLATDLNEQEAQGIGTEMELMGAKIRVISMKDLSEVTCQQEFSSPDDEKWRYYYRNYVRNKA